MFRLFECMYFQFVIASAFYPMLLIVSDKFGIYYHPIWMSVTRGNVLFCTLFCKIKEHRFNSYALQCRKLFNFCDYHGIHMTSFCPFAYSGSCKLRVLVFTVFDRFSLYCYQYTGQNLSVMAMLQFKLSCASGFAAKALI